MSEWKYKAEINKTGVKACQQIFSDIERWKAVSKRIKSADNPLKELWGALEAWEKRAFCDAVGFDYNSVRSVIRGMYQLSDATKQEIEKHTQGAIKAAQI